MPPSPSMSSPSASPLINPKLQEALSRLDLELEDELTRYRRQKAGLSVAPIVMRPKRKQQDPELVAFGGTDATHAETINGDNSPKAVSTDVEASAFELGMVPYETQTAEEALLELAGEEISEDELPKDYLESSEHLLKSLEQEEAKVQVERGFLQSLATPLGVGSMLALLISSAMFGYVIMNPASLSALRRAVSQFGSETAKVESSPDANAESEEIPNSPPLDSQEFIDLKLDNFAILRSIPNAVVPLPGKASPSPTAAPSPGVTASPSPVPEQSRTAAAVIAPAAPSSNSATNSVLNSAPAAPASAAPVAPRRSVASNRPAPQPAPSSVLLPSVSIPRTSSSSAASSPAPVSASPQLVYKIEAPYTGDRSLEAARQIVPDAFLRPDGKIQMGAVNSAEEAQQKVQDLKNQGISAEVNQR